MYANQTATSFSHYENAQPLGSGLIQYSSKALPLMLGLSLMFGTGSTQIFRTSDEKETILTEAQLLQELAYTSSLRNVVPSSSQQLLEIKHTMGLNILEMAAILHVSRPSIYDWLESKITIRNNNQKRIDSLYQICNLWKIKGLPRLGSFLHKKIGANNLSLFDLLKNENLNRKEINKSLETIAQAILQKKQDEKVHKDLLRKHSFEPVNKEDMEDRLNDLHFLD